MHKQMIDDIIETITRNTIFAAASCSFRKPSMVKKDPNTRITINSSEQLVKDIMSCENVKDFNKLGFSKSLPMIEKDFTERKMKNAIDLFFKSCNSLAVQMIRYINFSLYGSHDVVHQMISEYNEESRLSGGVRPHHIAINNIYSIFGAEKRNENNSIHFYDMENELAIIIIMASIDESYNDITLDEFNEKFKNESQETKDKVTGLRKIIPDDKIERLSSFWHE